MNDEVHTELSPAEAERVAAEQWDYLNRPAKAALRLYSIQVGERVVEFAAGEVSANVWAFYVPVEQAGT